MTILLTERGDGPVLTLTLNRPAAANALDSALQDALVVALAGAAADSGVRAMVLAAAGGRVFSAGADLKEWSELPPAAAATRRRAALLRTLRAVLDFPKPLVVALSGKAIGAGAMLAVLADRVVAAGSASLSMPEIRLGTPSPIGIAVLTPRGGRDAAFRLVQAGATLDAQDARALGLVDIVTDRGAVAMLSRQQAHDLAQFCGPAFSANKAWMAKDMAARLDAAAAEAQRFQDTLRAAVEQADGH